MHIAHCGRAYTDTILRAILFSFSSGDSKFIRFGFGLRIIQYTIYTRHTFTRTKFQFRVILIEEGLVFVSFCCCCCCCRCSTASCCQFIFDFRICFFFVYCVSWCVCGLLPWKCHDHRLMMCIGRAMLAAAAATTSSFPVSNAARSNRISSRCECDLLVESNLMGNSIGPNQFRAREMHFWQREIKMLW